MAANTSRLEAELSCAVCCEIFKDPVTLHCNHSFCKACLDQCWKVKRARECPVCRKRASMGELPPNFALRNIVESYLKEHRHKPAAPPAILCSLHEEKLKVFCLDDKEAICLVCQISKKHENHKCRPVEEAAQDYKKYKDTKRRYVRYISLLYCNECKHRAALTPEYDCRAECTLQDPQCFSGALIDVAEHLGSLKYKVWEKMLGIVQYTPVTLDPNTAHPALILSEDLTSVRLSNERQQLPRNPQHFDRCVSVLGSEGFTSGKHCWDVEVGNKPDWDLGVTKESSQRKGSITPNPGAGYWTIALRGGDQYKAGTSPETRLTLEKKPQKIRVQLDCDGGEVAFSDASDMRAIYTFKHRFTERMFPFFWSGFPNSAPLRICPVKAVIKLD
ncbi:UNVERIFIED_CONTAM: hypothetical protein FKN15_048848 [Acipenser sinensis]